MRGLVSIVGVCLCAALLSAQPATAPNAPIVWRVDNITAIAGHPVQRLGSPRVVQTDRGPAVAFNGKTDGLLIDVNPLAGLSRFTVEVVFSPDADGPEEQRFLHMQEASTE